MEDNLLEKASIVTTPTAYSDSKLASVKPNSGENLFLYSEDYSQSRWVKSNVTLSNASTSPFSGTATKLTSTTSSTWARIYSLGEIDYSKYVVSSVYLRSDTPFTASLRSRVSGGETVVKNINVTSTWQRFSILTNTSGRDNDIHIFLNENGVSGTSVNGRTLEVIAVQMERGNTPSSYLKTEGAIIKNGDFDFSRGSSATRVNSQGLIEDVATGNDSPRIDYTDGCGSLLLEPQSTNSVEYSEDFNDSTTTWTWNGVASEDKSYTAPDGSNNATLITLSNSNGQHNVWRKGTQPPQPTFSASIFAKKGNEHRLFLIVGGRVVGIQALFDLENGVVLDSNTIGTSTISNVKIEDFGSGWYRCSFVGTGVPGNTIGFSPYYQDTIGESIETLWQASGQSLHVWGAQLEGQSFPTSYIPTNGSAVTRLGETLTNSGNADLFNDSEGVLYFEGKHKQINSNKWLGIDNGSLQYAVKFLINNASNLIVWIKVNNVLVYQGGANTLSYNCNIFSDYFKAAVSYSSQGVKVYLNGQQVDSSSTAINMPSNTLNTLNFTRDNSTEPVFGNYKCVAVFKEALTDAELQSLTTI